MWTYDRDADALYIRFQDGSRLSRTVTVDSATLVDVDATGTVVGVEILRPAREWPIEDIAAAGKLTEAQRRSLEVLSREGGESGAFRYPSSGMAIAG